MHFYTRSLEQGSPDHGNVSSLYSNLYPTPMVILNVIIILKNTIEIELFLYIRFVTPRKPESLKHDEKYLGG